MRVALFVACVLLAIVTLLQSCNNSTAPDVPNHAPIFVEIPVQVVEEGFRLQFVVEASDSDGTVPVLSVRGAPANSVAVDSGNGKMVFVFEPDLSQSGVYFVIFEASDGRSTSSLVVTIEVDPNRWADTWPMAVGNRWLYQIDYWSGDDMGNGYGESRLDSICVLSSYQRDGIVHWCLYSGVPFAGGNVAFQNDSILGMSQKIPVPSTWPNRVDSVPAGEFSPTYLYIVRGGSFSWMETFSFVFAKNVGVIKYSWFNGRAMHPEWQDAVLVSYRIR